MLKRPRRLRVSESIREMVAETVLQTQDLIYPIFIMDKGTKSEIESMPGQFRLPRKILIKEIEQWVKLGLSSFCLFPKVDDSLKDSKGSYALDSKCYYYEVLRELKKEFPHITLMTDVALDPYSSDGHDGIVCKKTGKILNDDTLEVLAKMSVLQAQAGADIIGPSDMMDGRVGHIRKALEFSKFTDTLIMSYSAKYASAFYGPFRDALDSAPRGGDKKTYQMDPRNRKEALKEAIYDEQEGADILMVKPALSYLDIISDLSRASKLPIAAYQVSGEYSMIKAAAKSGCLNEEAAMLETLTSIKRAGAKIILTYFAPQAAKLLLKN
jgi:porphobilinogen synthase